MDVILESVPINIPNMGKCRVNHGLTAEVPLEDNKKKSILQRKAPKTRTMDPEELKIIEDERQGILNGILDELQTQSLRDLFLTRVKKKIG